MTVEQLTWLAFASGVLVTGAIGFVLRGILVPHGAGAGTVSGRRLRRIVPTADLTDRSRSAIDRAFDSLVIESGTQIVPASAFLLCVAGAIMLGGVTLVSNPDPLIAVGMSLIGFLVPLAWLAFRRAQRVKAVQTELPQVLDMLARATRAGQSIEQGIDLVAHEAGGILGAEFGHCSRQLAMGRAFDRVLISLASRVRVLELRILTTTLVVQRQAGGHLSDTLERMAGVVRDRLVARRQINAATASGRASTLVIATIAPVAYLFVFLFHRAHLQVMFDDELGRSLLLAALILEIIGLAWVFYLLRSESQ
ncbi:MAG: type II secretion system F family protein [Planctomycetota bacterium]|jgi:tight adherence protein B